MSTEEQSQQPAEERYYQFPCQELSIQPFVAEGYILDVGGGGEGIIGLLKGQQVIAIDLLARELEEAPAGGLKIVMDARDLQFLNDTFQDATAFFSMMFFKAEDQPKMLAEIWRVLARGGVLRVWDVLLPVCLDPRRDIAVFPFTFHLPDRTIQTGYGTRWPDKPHDLAYFSELVQAAGFEIINCRQEGHIFSMELRKP